MYRIINGYRVYGKPMLTIALTEAVARANINNQTYLHIWEIKNIGGRIWEAYVAEKNNCIELSN